MLATINYYETALENFQTLQIHRTANDDSMIETTIHSNGSVSLVIYNPTTEFLKSLVEVATQELNRREK